MQQQVVLSEENRIRVTTAQSQGNGIIPIALCKELCAGVPGTDSCQLGPSGENLSCVYTQQIMHPAGRAYAGVSPAAEAEHVAPLVRWLLKTAHLEQSAVHEFDALAKELAHHGAPAALIQGALSARDDEVRHSQLLRELCIEHGAEPAPLTVVPQPQRALLDIALNNTIQGCTLETWGALQATWQAHNAKDAGIRAALATIASDESRHASFSWELDRWLRTQLTAEQCAELDQAASNAVSQARSKLAAKQPHPEHTKLGLPNAAEAVALFDLLQAA